MEPNRRPSGIGETHRRKGIAASTMTVTCGAVAPTSQTSAPDSKEAGVYASKSDRVKIGPQLIGPKKEDVSFQKTVYA